MRVFFLYLFFILNIVSIQSQELLLSTNKSGTHFFLYSLQYLTSKPIKNIGGNGFAKFHTNLDISPDKDPIYHTHIPQDTIHYLSGNDQLIFLTRSPIELFLRRP